MRIFISRIILLLAVLLLMPPALAQSDDYQEASKLFKQGQSAQALEHIEIILKDDPRNARARFLKGLIQNDEGKQAEAIQTFEALSEDYPELPEPYNNLAVIYAAQGNYERAREALEMAIRTHPSYATAHENLGDIYAKMASQAYDKALQYDKTDTTAQTKLALIKELFSTTQPPAKSLSGAAETIPATVVAPPPTPVNPIVADSSGEVVKTVNDWARAWSQKDVNNYLAFYASSFQTPHGQSRQDWEMSRKTRIVKPKKIEVTVGSLQVKFTDDHRVTVTFRQDYRSARLQTSTTKTLVMVKDGDRWLIQQERAGS